MRTVGEKLARAFRENVFPDIETMTAFDLFDTKKFYELKAKKYSIEELNKIAKVDENYKECVNCCFVSYTKSNYCPNCSLKNITR